MKLYFCHIDSTVYKNDNKIYLADKRGTKFLFNNNSIRTIGYSLDKFFYTYRIDNLLIDVCLNKDARYGDDQLVENGNILFLSNGVLIPLDKPTQYSLLYASTKNIDKIFVSEYEDKEGINTIFYNFKTNTYKKIMNAPCMAYYYGENEYYYLPSEGPFILKADDSLNIQWALDKNVRKSNITYPRFVDNMSQKPLCFYKDTVIVNLTATLSHQKSLTRAYYNPDGTIMEMCDESFFIDGTIYSLYKKDGTVKWTQTFPVQVDDIIQLTEEKIISASERYLYIIDADTGVIDKKINTEIRTGERQECASITLLIHDNYLFVFSLKDCSMQIWNKNTLEKLRTIDAHEQGWQFAVHRPKIIDNHIFVPVAIRDNQISGGAIFVIDTDNIHAPLEVEEVPKFERILPSKGNTSGIHFTVNHPDWGYVLRFAERELLTEIGEIDRSEDNKNFTPRKVKLTYSGYTEKKEVVEDKLKIFKDRFERYVPGPHVLGVSFKPIQFEYELI
jgi:outer membrane protein assembly factor BamB